MVRLLVALFSSVAVSACVEVPSPPMRPSPGPPDGSIAAELAVDASLLRPATAEPYTGPQDVAASGWRPDAATSVKADDAGSGSAGSAPTPAPSAPVSPPAAPKPVAPQSARPSRPSAIGEIVITEIMSNPSAVPDTEGEWVELYNPSSKALDLAGCGLDDGGKTPHAISAALVLEPAAFATIARSASAGFAADLLLPISLSNDADVVALICDGKQIDRVAYGPGFPLGPGASMSLDPQMSDASANDSASAWCLAKLSYGSDLGTPGAPNPDCDSSDAGAE
jgi:hypothetical protein